MINKVIKISELSSLCGKSRPTIYKHYKNYIENKTNNIPYSFIKLFNLIAKKDPDKKEIINYCNKTFKNIENEIEISEIISILKKNRTKINLEHLKLTIIEEIKNG